MAVTEARSTATSQRRQFHSHSQQRQRAPLSCGHTPVSLRKHPKRVLSSCRCLASKTQKSQPLLLTTSLGALHPYSFSTYRDDGALSEVSIADCISQQASNSQGEYQASPASLPSSAQRNAPAAPSIQVDSHSKAWKALQCLFPCPLSLPMFYKEGPRHPLESANHLHLEVTC